MQSKPETHKNRRFTPATLIFVVLVVSASGVLLWQNYTSAPIRQHIDAGTKALQDGQPTQAEKEWLAATQLDPNNTQAWSLLGDYYLAEQDWQQAVRALRNLARIAPDMSDVHVRLALAAWQLNDGKLAQDQAKLQLQQNANDIQALQVLADIAKSYNHKEDELRYLQQLAQLQPQDAAALSALANFYTENFDYGKAQPLLERILKINPNSADAYMMRGLAFYNQNPTPQRLEAAKVAFKKIVVLNPQELEAHRYLGRVYMRLNQPRQAIEEFEHLGRGRPYASAHFMELANAYRKAGDSETADKLQNRFTALKQLNQQIQSLSGILERDANDFETNLKLGVLLLQTVVAGGDGYELYHFRYVKQKLKAADFYLERARLQRPQDAALKAALQKLERTYVGYWQAGLKNLQNKQMPQADWNLSRAVLLRPDDSRTQTALQQALLISKQIAQNSPSAFPLLKPNAATNSSGQTK